MKRIILNENKFNVLLEYAGFVDGFQYLIEHIYNISLNNTERLIKSIVRDRKGKTREQIFDEFEYYDNVSLDKPLKDWVIPQHHLKMVNINDIKQITIKYFIDDNVDGGFDNNSVSMDEQSGLINNITIVINIKQLFLMGNDYMQTLQHEFTHAYETIQRYKQNGESSTNMNYSNKYYNIQKGVVDGMSYYFSQTEINAAISETAYMLRQYKPSNEEECWNLINNENSYAYKFLKSLNTIANNLKTNISCTYAVIEFLRMKPEHIDMFPNPRNQNVSSYQRRLIRVADYKVDYFKKKLNKVVKSYLQRKGVVN